MKNGVIGRLWGVTCGRCQRSSIASRFPERRQVQHELGKLGWVDQGYPAGWICPICAAPTVSVPEPEAQPEAESERSAES